tara:strand:+ start:467 stop:1192 length:726 start_codon:yes stop_codon:yes gene_type:complete
MIKKNIPNLFTILNLIFGCLGVLSISSLNFKATLILTIFCVFFDFLDGFFARLLKVKSEFGKELDSLADIVSFGLVPGFLMYKLYVMTGQEDFFLFFDFKISYIALFGFLITVSAMIRLAKFNLSNSQVFSFKGFPSPANAVFIVSIPIFFDSDFFNNSYQYLNIPTLTIITLLSALIMNVNLKFIKISYDSSNKKNFFYSIVFLILSTILIILFMEAAVTLIICAYILISFADQITSKLK